VTRQADDEELSLPVGARRDRAGTGSVRFPKDEGVRRFETGVVFRSLEARGADVV
jgi:hypothetical protein